MVFFASAPVCNYTTEGVVYLFMLIVYLVFFLGLSVVLVKATEMVIKNLHGLAVSFGVGVYGITALVLALSTSFPELSVGVTAAIRGDPQLSLGNVIGSNIANLSLILGGAAVLSGAVVAHGTFLREEVFHTFLAGALPLLLLIDGRLSRIDGLLLVGVYGVYAVTVLKEQRRALIHYHLREEGLFKRLWYRIHHTHADRWGRRLLLGVVLLIGAANLMVRVAEQIAILLHLPLLLIGLVVVAVGTSLPELSFEIIAIRRRESKMALGNILGSVVANSTLVLGLTALISPIVFHNGLQPYLLATIAFIIIFGLFWVFVHTKKALLRWEGLVLVVAYCLFVVIELKRL